MNSSLGIVFGRELEMPAISLANPRYLSQLRHSLSCLIWSQPKWALTYHPNEVIMYTTCCFTFFRVLATMWNNPIPLFTCFVLCLLSRIQGLQSQDLVLWTASRTVAGKYEASLMNYWISKWIIFQTAGIAANIRTQTWKSSLEPDSKSHECQEIKVITNIYWAHIMC